MIDTEQLQPTPYQKAELTSTERGGVITMHLALGNYMTTREVAELVGLTRTGAWRLMQRLCRVMPVTFIEGDGNDPGIWRLDSESL